MTELETPRVRLRAWREADLPAFAALNADPEVRRWFPGTLTREQSDASAAALQAHLAAYGFGFWAVEVPGVAPFIGFVGLQTVSFAAHFTPATDLGWRLGRAYWGHGYATEAARAALAYGRALDGLPTVVSFTVPGNAPSRRVMERIGMRHDPDGDFDHPALPEAHPMRSLPLTHPALTLCFGEQLYGIR